MTNILNDLRNVQRLNGDTYSSYEVLGMVGRAADEIERLKAALRKLEYADAEWVRNLARAALEGK